MIWCNAIMYIPKDTANSIAYQSAAATAFSMTVVVDESERIPIIVDEAGEFTVGAIDDSSYEFGDNFELDEVPSDDDLLFESESFTISDFIAGAEGTGFMKSYAGFTIIPSFETVLWYFKVNLEMPTEYFDTENVLVTELTFGPTDGSFDDATIMCAVQIGNPDEVVIREFNASFDSSDINSGETILNYQAANENTDSDWSRDYSYEKYDLVESLNGKSRQSCVVIVEVDPMSSDYFFGKDYELTVSGKVYDSWDAADFATPKELEPYTYPITVPAPDFEFKELDFTASDIQDFAYELNAYSTKNYLGLKGKAETFFYAQFEVKPTVDDADDSFRL